MYNIKYYYIFNYNILYIINYIHFILLIFYYLNCEIHVMSTQLS